MSLNSTMNDSHTVLTSSEEINAHSEQLSYEVAVMAGRLSLMLKNLFADDNQVLGNTVSFLDHVYSNTVGEILVSQLPDSILQRLDTNPSQPLAVLTTGLGLSDLELELLIVAGMAEEHEGYADIFRTLHPQSQPYATAGLAAHLLCETQEERLALRAAANTGRLFGKGVLQLVGDGPFYTKSLIIPADIWSVLHGIDQWPDNLQVQVSTPTMYGLEEWFESDEVTKLTLAVQNRLKCTLYFTADNNEIAKNRAVSLIYHSGSQPVCFQLPVEPNTDIEKEIFVHSLIRGVAPVVQIPFHNQAQGAHLSMFEDYPKTLIVCAQSGANISLGSRTLLSYSIEKLSAAALRRMWRKTIPELQEHAAILAARYPVEPAQAQQVAQDIATTHHNGSKPELSDITEFIRARSVTRINTSVQLIRPLSSWEQLVLPQSKVQQLREAVHRLHLQDKVLDEWRFLEGRRGARGVRMLFSGPPGTGKTLSAEVMAHSLGVDLLLVDLSRVVSKWIGETEKNLAQVFDTAEDTKAVLLFDEADALFGKRTEISDAHDRYANLETAYLLSRLERYDGLAILSTNLQQNIDAAFIRRLEFVVEYQEPDREQRLALWKCHIPKGVNLAPDVSLEELAAHFPIVGGLIRNAAVAAAFLAASDDAPISKEHFIHAIKREYDKSGKAYRGMPSERMKTVSGGK